MKEHTVRLWGTEKRDSPSPIFLKTAVYDPFNASIPVEWHSSKPFEVSIGAHVRKQFRLPDCRAALSMDEGSWASLPSRFGAPSPIGTAGMFFFQRRTQTGFNKMSLSLRPD